MQMNKEGTEWDPGLDMKLRNKTVAEIDADAGALGEWDNPWPSLIWSGA